MSENLSSLVNNLYPQVRFHLKVNKTETKKILKKAGFVQLDDLSSGKTVTLQLGAIAISYQYDQSKHGLNLEICLSPNSKRHDFYFQSIHESYEMIMQNLLMFKDCKKIAISDIDGSQDLMRFLALCAKLHNIPCDQDGIDGVDDVFERTEEHLKTWFTQVNLPTFSNAPPQSPGLSMGMGSASGPNDLEEKET